MWLEQFVGKDNEPETLFADIRDFDLTAFHAQFNLGNCTSLATEPQSFRP